MYEPWCETGSWHYVGELFARDGVPYARKAIEAKRAGDEVSVLRYAKAAWNADRAAKEAQAAGCALVRSNVTGNAWSGWYESITCRAAPSA